MTDWSSPPDGMPGRPAPPGRPWRVLIALTVVVVALLVVGAVAFALHHRTTVHTFESPPGQLSTTTPGAGLGGGATGSLTTPSSSGSTAAPPPTAPPTTAGPVTLPPVAPVSWKPCTGNQGPDGDDCATVMVPLDYTKATGTKIGIALARQAATGSKIGSLIMNPGGPGASGVDGLDYLASLLSPADLAHFDIVTFDPRGVARSDGVRCETGPQLDQFIHLNPAPTTEAGFQQLLAAARAFAAGCEARSGAILPFVGTINAARDMDEIRSAVGDAKLTYMGFSYGTFLGATYAELFPTHIRAMVLDGALDPAADPITSNTIQAAGFDQQLGAFFAYCTGNTLCPWKPGRALRTDYDALIARIVANPLPGDGSRTLGPGEAFFAVAEELYDQTLWPALATGLANADAGDGALLLEYSDEYTQRNSSGAYTNSLEANNAISCVDQPWPRDPTVLQRGAVTAKQKAPEFGVADLYGALTCTAWPAPPTSSPHAISAAGSPPIVVVGSTGDPATPYADAVALAGQLQHGVLLTRVGDGHTGYRSSACIRSHVDSYLVSLTVPASGIRCPSP
jgi:pimeloyl-ACP methyl ester carboxylesterase